MTYFRAEEQEAANLSLSWGSAVNPLKPRRRRSKRGSDGSYECRTCSQKFPSYQALGGHRTSHFRTKVAVSPQQGQLRGSWKLRPSVHKCSVCGRGFPVGQALGGHMRQHRIEAAASPDGAIVAGGDVIDLNSAQLVSEDGNSGDVSRHDLILLQLFK